MNKNERVKGVLLTAPSRYAKGMTWKKVANMLVELSDYVSENGTTVDVKVKIRNVKTCSPYRHVKFDVVVPKDGIVKMSDFPTTGFQTVDEVLIRNPYHIDLKAEAGYTLSEADDPEGF